MIAINRKYLPIITAAVIFFVGYGALLWAESAFHLVLLKTRTPLQKPLDTLPRTLGLFHMRRAWANEKLSSEVVQVLGTKHYLIRRYWYRPMSRSLPGAVVRLNVNYYPTNFASPHVPNVCWEGAGLVLEKDSYLTLHNIPHADGKKGNLTVRFLSFALPQTDSTGLPIAATGGSGLYLNTAYVFQVDGKYVPNPAQVSELFWQKHSKYGYDAKIEIDVLGATSQKFARRQIERFFRAALPAIENCLPNWKKLNAPAVLPHKADEQNGQSHK
ncbi:MAG: exosortase-associated EpsI family protein [Phycisphaerae bacterium]